MFHSIVTIIPCYNVEAYVKKVVSDAISKSSHVIAINDGSTDKTYEVLKNIKDLDSSHIHILNFPINQGKGFGLVAGMKYALEHLHFDVLVTIDADGQHCASFIPELVQPVFDGCDFVIAERPFANMPNRSRFGNKWISFLLKLGYRKAPKDTQSGFRSFSKKLTQEIVATIKGGRYETEFRMLLTALQSSYKIRSISIPAVYIDKNKSSHFSPIKDAIRILKVLIGHVLGVS